VPCNYTFAQKADMTKKLPLVLLLMAAFGSLFSQNIGAYEWAKLIGTKNGDDLIWDMTTDATGNVYVTGKFAVDTIDLDPGAGEQLFVSAGFEDVFFAKYTAEGQLVWAKTIGGQLDDESHSIVLDNNNNIWLTGTFQATVDFNPGVGVNTLSSQGNRDIFLAKYDNNGNYLWAGAMGGPGDDLANKMAKNPLTGDIWICGGFESTADFDPSGTDYLLTSNGAKDIFYARYNTAGTLIGARRLQGGNNDLATGIAFDKSGNMLLSGVFVGNINFNPTGTAYNLTSNAGSNDGFVAKYDQTATLVWARALGGKTNNDYAINVEVDTADNVMVCGYYSDSCTFHPGVGLSNKVARGVVDAYIACYTPAGAFQGLIVYGSPNEYTVARDVAVDISGYLYVTGYASGDFDAGNDINTHYLVTVAGKNAYLSKYDSYGNFIWAQNISLGAASATGYCAHYSLQGGIYVGGELKGTGDFDPSVLNRGLTSYTNSFDAFFAKYFNCSIPGQVFYETDTICQGETATITASANFSYTVGWYADAQLTQYLGQNNINTPSLQANTVYYLMDSVCGIKKVTPVTVQVNQLPSPIVNVDGKNLVSDATGVTYEWRTCPSEDPIQGATSVSFAPTVSGSYTVYVVDTITGCVNNSSCINYNILGLTDLEDAGINVYPNPATNLLNVQVLDNAYNGPIELKIVNVTGQILAHEQYTAQPVHSINLSGLPAGLYTLTIKQLNKSTSIQFSKSL
jgi:hypothetical protein